MRWLVCETNFQTPMGMLIQFSFNNFKSFKDEVVMNLMAPESKKNRPYLHEIRIEDVPEKVKAMIGEENLSGPLYDGISTSHRQYNELYERVGDVWFSLEKDESYGTNRLFWLSWAIISALVKGTVLFIDEYDSGIHPYIARQVVDMFYRCKTKAQLIINTQNASLLRYKTADNQKLFVKKY